MVFKILCRTGIALFFLVKIANSISIEKEDFAKDDTTATASDENIDIFSINERAHALDHLYDGDIKLDPFRNAHGTKWPKSSDGLAYIPYTLDERLYHQLEKDVIISAAEEINKHTCIRFIPRTTEKHYVRIIDSLFGGCSSHVGKVTEQPQTLSLAVLLSYCIHKGVVMHELIHTAGFVHEQSRSDRDNYIRVMPENFRYPDTINFGNAAATNFGKRNSINLVPYDYNSIMHYGQYGRLTKQPYLSYYRFNPKRSVKPKTGNIEQLTAYDIEELKYHYECQPGTWTRCGRDFVNKTRGSFKSPNYPKRYDDESYCIWNITVHPGKFVEVTFIKVEIDQIPLCEFESIIVHDGPNAGAPTLRRFCGKRSKSLTLTSTGNSMFIMFRSANYRYRVLRSLKGFRARFREVTTSGPPPPTPPTNVDLVPVVSDFVEKFNCHFQNNLCGMTQDTMDDADFKLVVGKRVKCARDCTGPLKGDYDRGIGGKYIIVTTRNLKYQTAQIRSPWFRGNRSILIKFSYNMHGASMGMLRLYAYAKTTADRIAKHIVLWEKHGQQSSPWHVAEITFTPDSSVEYVQFYWQVNTNSRLSDIALDAISIKRSKCLVPPDEFRCNFDEGLCGLTQVTSDQFNWTKENKTTPSFRTGPTKDHTNGRGRRGAYLFIEASNPQKPGDVAQLKSPKLSVETHCVKMWYHMWGKHIEALTLYKEIDGMKYRIRQINGNKGDKWRQLTVNLTTNIPKQSYQTKKIDECSSLKLVIEATVGNGSKGDIAIDDLEITNKPCETIIKPITKLSCNFDTRRKLCGLQQSTKDQFDWTRHKGSTPTNGTGPTADNTQSTADGYYMYIEASKPRKEDDEAILLTPEFRPGQYCVRFAYHSYGKSAGSLTVFSREGTDGEPRIRWLISRGVGKRWMPVSFEYNSVISYETIQFMFSGKVGRTSSGDIAIDDLNITSGACPPRTRATRPPRTTRTTTSYRTSTTRPIVTATTTTPSTTARTPPTVPDRQWSGMPLCTFGNKQTDIESTTAVESASPNDLGAYILPARIRNDTLCGWFQFKSSDDFDWTRRRGATPSSKTGPSGDKTSGNGHYMYIEASRPRERNDVAFMQTYKMPAYDYCVQVNYHMYGVNMGKLVIRSIQALRNGTRQRLAISETTDGHRNRWQSKRISFSPVISAKSVAFRLEGVVGNGSKSDIAVDDTTISPGTCAACQTPSHTYTTPSNEVKNFAAGCIHTELFYTRCCGPNQPKFIYRRVRNCGGNMFSAAQLYRFCGK